MRSLEELEVELESALLLLDRVAARRVIMDQGDSLTPLQMVEKLMPPVLRRIGDGWDQGKVAMSQVYMSGRICEELVGEVTSQVRSPKRPHPRMAIVVLEDYHLLGKRIVGSVLRASGFELLDYGRMEAEEVVQQVKRDGVRYLLISTLMLPSALRVKDVTTGLGKARTDVKVVVGGAPFRFDDRLWKEVGADAHGLNSGEAIEIVTRLIEHAA